MSPLYNFGFSQEDERTEEAALAPMDRHGILCIASGGDMPLSLVALGAHRVVAVDMDERQLHLCRLKAAAIRVLDREAAQRFLGFLPATAEQRRAWMRDVREALPAASSAFWGENGDLVARHGAVWAARYERFLRRFLFVVRPLLGAGVRELCRCTTPEEQRAVFDRRLRPAWMHWLFRVAFHPWVFRGRGMDQRSLAHRTDTRALGEQFFSRYRAFCTATPASHNPWLQIHMLGRLLHMDAAPAYLTSHGFARVREALDCIEWAQSDLLAFARGGIPAGITRLHLSNVPDWMGPGEFTELMRRLATGLPGGSRLVWRYLHVDRALPPDVADRMVVDLDLGERLRAVDRFPFYAIVPATLK